MEAGGSEEITFLLPTERRTKVGAAHRRPWGRRVLEGLAGAPSWGGERVERQAREAERGGSCRALWATWEILFSFQEQMGNKWEGGWSCESGR